MGRAGKCLQKLLHPPGWALIALPTAMISRFSGQDEAYRRMMNAITGGFVYGIVILIAVFMLFRAGKGRRKAETVE